MWLPVLPHTTLSGIDVKLRDILGCDRPGPFPRPARERVADALADAGEGRSDEELL